MRHTGAVSLPPSSPPPPPPLIPLSFFSLFAKQSGWFDFDAAYSHPSYPAGYVFAHITICTHLHENDQLVRPGPGPCLPMCRSPLAETEEAGAAARPR